MRLFPHQNSDFNPRSREGSDALATAKNYQSSIFQSTLPRGERPAFPEFRAISSNFNPRSREGSDCIIFTFSFKFSNFNPRSREGSDRLTDVPPVSCRISIHAPARGATFRQSMRDEDIKISIHAPARGATFFIILMCFSFTNFNPRSREGSDTIYPASVRPVSISIHAPARGATHCDHTSSKAS